jgi:hypothetical protein
MGVIEECIEMNFSDLEVKKKETKSEMNGDRRKRRGQCGLKSRSKILSHHSMTDAESGKERDFKSNFKRIREKEVLNS